MMAMRPTISFVNHAGFIYDDGLVRVLSDPWLHGTAFDDGWCLLSQTRFRPGDFHNITHIWVSHEHPDHFSPGSLRSIPPEAARNITFLFQATADKKVIKFCHGLNFKDVVELDPASWHSLSPRTRVRCIPVLSDTNCDSLLCFKTDDVTILNLNDCYFEREQTAAGLANEFAPVDVLMTQFSFAGWAGNPDDVPFRREVAAQSMKKFISYIKMFKPAFTIPFASFIYFCNEENRFMNAEANRVHRAVAEASSQTATKPIVLYPAESWTVSSPHDNAGSLAAYENDYQTAPERLAPVKNPVVTQSDLQALARTFLAKLKKRNNSLLIRLLPAAHIYVTDLQSAFRLSLAGLDPIPLARGRCDVALGSEALSYAFRYMWGGDTLNINGRFVKESGSFWHFRAWFAVAALNNIDELFSFAFVFRNLGLMARKLASYLSDRRTQGI
jgi:hypothetical protein